MSVALMPFALGYLVGSIPMAWFIVRLATRRDVSRQGSENVGALNALRVAKSKWVGILVMVLDGLKGAAAVYVAAWWTGSEAFLPLAAGGLGAIAGHNYNAWLSFAQRRLVGGKGFAAASGMLFVIRPWLVPAWLITVLLAWGLFKVWRGIVDEAPASAVATMLMIPVGYVLYDGPTAWLGVGMALLCMPKIMVELKTLLFPAAPDESAATDA